jgi:hypothetical protein
MGFLKHMTSSIIVLKKPLPLCAKKTLPNVGVRYSVPENIRGVS